MVSYTVPECYRLYFKAQSSKTEAQTAPGKSGLQPVYICIYLFSPISVNLNHFSAILANLARDVATLQRACHTDYV